jgi:hypothetical protein
MRQCLLFFLLALGGATAAQAQVNAAAQSHCSADETPLFTCQIGPKIASVCGSKDLNAANAYVQYRFGKKDAVELEAPPKATDKPAPVGHMHAMCTSCTGDYLRFSSGGTRYYVFSASMKDPKTGASNERAGVVVMENGQVTDTKLCTSPATDLRMDQSSLGRAAVRLKPQDDIYPLDLAFPGEP